MSAPPGLRKGWCPGALRPMPARDGLLVRLRVTAGRLSAGTLRAIAMAGRSHGNGLFDLTSRGNLQMRGVSEGSLARLLEILRALGLLDETVAGEAVRNVQVNPLAGLDGPDLGPIAAALERALVADESLHALPGKFAFLIDDASVLSLSDILADIRFVHVEPGSFAIGLGGCDRDAAFVGTCALREIVPNAVRLARAFLDLSARLPEESPRMRDLFRATRPEAIAAAADLPFAPPRIVRRAPVAAPCLIGLLRLGNGASCFGIGAAFGRLDSSMLVAAADAAEILGSGEIRLTPWRALLLTGVARAQEQAAIADLSGHGFITDPQDARLAVAACVGVAGCESATTDTHADALLLAGLARRLAPSGLTLHVSGCAKGCARPQSTPVVLVAREGRYDMILKGAAGHTPMARGLTSVEAHDLLDKIASERLVIS